MEENEISDLTSKVVDEINAGNEHLYTKGEYLGYFLNRFVKYYLSANDFKIDAFNSFAFEYEKKKKISNYADAIVLLIPKNDPISVIWKIRKALQEVIVKVIANNKDKANASGYALYVLGMISKLYHEIESKDFKVDKAGTSTHILQNRRLYCLSGMLKQLINDTSDLVS